MPPVRDDHRFDTVDLPSEVAAELAGYIRSSLFAPLSSNITRLREECEDTLSTQKDSLQDVALPFASHSHPCTYI